MIDQKGYQEHLAHLWFIGFKSAIGNGTAPKEHASPLIIAGFKAGEAALKAARIDALAYAIYCTRVPTLSHHEARQIAETRIG